MKKFALINTVLLAIFASIVLVSCNAPVVSLTNDGQKITMKSASGNVEPERYIAIGKKQAQGEFVEEAYSQAIESIKKGDQQKAQGLINLVKQAESPTPYVYVPPTNPRPGTTYRQQAQSESKDYKSLVIKNLSKNYTFEFLSGPLNGLVLAPGASSPNSYNLEIGTTNMLYRLTNETGKQSTHNFNFPVSKTTPALELSVDGDSTPEKAQAKAPVQKVAPAKPKAKSKS